MNSSPTIEVVSVRALRQTAKSPEAPTVPDMHLLCDLITRAARNPQTLQRAIQQCSGEERALLNRFFIRTAVK